MSISGSVVVMNLIMIDISPILLFLLELFTYFAQRNAHFFLVLIFAQNSASKSYQCLVTTTHISWCHHVTTEVTSEVITRDLGGQLTRRGGVRRNHTRGRSSNNNIIENKKYKK